MKNWQRKGKGIWVTNFFELYSRSVWAHFFLCALLCFPQREFMPTRIFPLILVLFIAILPFAIYRGTPAVFASFKRCFVSLGWNPLSRANKLPACWKAIGQKKRATTVLVGWGGGGKPARENQLQRKRASSEPKWQYAQRGRTRIPFSSQFRAPFDYSF